jgi:hypothetical protein
MNEQSRQRLDAMQGELARRVNAMARICAGMTTEELEAAQFTYQSLLHVVERRESLKEVYP